MMDRTELESILDGMSLETIATDVLNGRGIRAAVADAAIAENGAE